MKKWLAAAALAALGACIENPDVDHRLRVDKPALPNPPSPDKSNMITVDIDSGILGAYAYRTGVQGHWKFAVENLSSSDLPAAVLILQANYPTFPSCCGIGSPDFFPTPQFETIDFIPALAPHQKADLDEFGMSQIQDPDDLVYVKAIRLRDNGKNPHLLFHHAGLYEGGYMVLRNGVPLPAGHLKAVIDGYGQMGISVMPDRPDFIPMSLSGNFGLDSTGGPTYLHANYNQDSVLSRELPTSAYRETQSGFEIRFGIAPPDTVVLTLDKVALVNSGTF